MPEASAGSWHVFLHLLQLMWTLTSAQQHGGDSAFLPNSEEKLRHRLPRKDRSWWHQSLFPPRGTHS